MAKEITPTPVLEGKDAVNFLLKMNEPSSDAKKELLDKIKDQYEPIF